MSQTIVFSLAALILTVYSHAADGVDHTFSNQTITFAGNYSLGDSECAVVNVTTIDDNIVEGTEVILVFITPGPIVASIFIIDNDCKALLHMIEFSKLSCRFGSWF